MKKTNFKLNPSWVTGLIDDEGSFNIRFFESKYHKTDWFIWSYFQVGLAVKDTDLLLQIKSFFGIIFIHNYKE